MGVNINSHSRNISIVQNNNLANMMANDNLKKILFNEQMIMENYNQKMMQNDMENNEQMIPININCFDKKKNSELIKNISKKLKYIDLKNIKQINDLLKQLSFYSSDTSNKIDISDPLYYINRPRKIINFILYNKIIKKSVPNSITKFDLYTIAFPIFCRYNINFILIHKNKILNNDKTSIDCISDNDFIIIIEDKKYPDKSYYNSLLLKYGDKINVPVNFGINTTNFLFPQKIKLAEIYKTINSYFGLNENLFNLIINGLILNKNDNFLSESSTIKINETKINMGNIFEYIYGKKINVIIKDIEKIKNFINKDNYVPSIKLVIGILNSTKNIIYSLFSHLCINEKLNEINFNKFKLIINDNIINFEDDINLLTFGIKKNLECYIQYE